MCLKLEFIVLFLLSLSKVKTPESLCNFNTVKSLEFMIGQFSIFVVNFGSFPPPPTNLQKQLLLKLITDAFTKLEILTSTKIGPNECKGQL